MRSETRVLQELPWSPKALRDLKPLLQVSVPHTQPWESNTQSLWGQLHPIYPNCHPVMMDGRHEKEDKAGCDGKKTFAHAGHWSDMERTKKQRSACAAGSTREVKEGRTPCNPCITSQGSCFGLFRLLKQSAFHWVIQTILIHFLPFQGPQAQGHTSFTFSVWWCFIDNIFWLCPHRGKETSLFFMLLYKDTYLVHVANPIGPHSLPNAPLKLLLYCRLGLSIRWLAQKRTIQITAASFTQKGLCVIN